MVASSLQGQEPSTNLKNDWFKPPRRQRRKQRRKQSELVFFHLVFLAKKPSQNCPIADDANDELSGLDVEVPDETITAPLV